MLQYKVVTLLGVAALMGGCASHSSNAVLFLDAEKPQYQTADCQRALQDASVHDDIKLTRMFVTPVAVFLSGGVLALPAIAANAGLDTADHLSASYISQTCGGQGKSAEQIGTEVAKGVAVGVVLSGVTAGAVPTGNN